MTNPNFIESESIPLLSLGAVPESSRRRYVELLLTMSPGLLNNLGDPRTGSFTRGLAKAYGLPVEKSAVIALTILKVVVGELKENALGSVLAQELPLAGEKAQKMATEIERDLLLPVRGELDKYWQGLKRDDIGKKAAQNGRIETVTGKAMPPRDPNNVLDLTKDKRPPLPPMPR